MAARLQAFALCLMALALSASAQAPGYYYGSRRLSQASGFGRQLQQAGYYYGGHHRRLFSEASTGYYYGSSHRRLQGSAAAYVRPLFGNSFVAGAAGAAAADIPVPQFLSRQLQSAGRQLTYYYGGSQRRLQGAVADLANGGRQLSYYYGSR